MAYHPIDSEHTSQTEMSGKDNQIRKYGIMSFITCHHYSSTLAIHRPHISDKVVWLPGSLSGLLLSLLTSISSSSDRVREDRLVMLSELEVKNPALSCPRPSCYLLVLAPSERPHQCSSNPQKSQQSCQQFAPSLLT